MSLFDSDRADPDEHMFVLVITPVASLALPIAVVFVMPVLVVPVVISTVLVGERCQ